MVLRVFVIAVAALSVAGCVRDPYVAPLAAYTPAGNWKIERQADRITGAPIASALLYTIHSSNSAEVLQKPAGMQLTCFDKRPFVRFSFEFKIGTDTNSSFAYRFDEKPGREINARFVQGNTVVVIEDKAEVAQFISELATSSQLFIRMRSITYGRTTAEFQLAGAPEAIAAGFAECPLVGPPTAAPVRSTSRNRRRT